MDVLEQRNPLTQNATPQRHEIEHKTNGTVSKSNGGSLCQVLPLVCGLVEGI